MSTRSQYLRWVMRSGKRLAVTVIGALVLLAGVVMLLLPGPGILTVAAGLAILGTEYAWAHRALRSARQRASSAAGRIRGRSAR